MKSAEQRWVGGLLAAAAVVVLLATFFLLDNDSEQSSTEHSDSAQSGVARPGAADSLDSAQQSDTASPFSVSDDSTTAQSAGTSVNEVAVGDSTTANSGNNNQTTSSADNNVSNLPPVDLYELGRSPIGDAEFASLVARLQADPALLQSLLDEFRLETDPDRLRRLSQLLGDVNDPSITLAASELIFSGDPQSRAIGLDLLKRIQPGNSEAHDIVSGLLTTEIETDVLVDTLTAIARPGVVDNQTRSGLSEQVALLTSHEDPAVRRSSLNILSRWSNDPQHTPILLGGLSDNDDSVRQSAAYALVGHEDTSEAVIQQLFSVVESTNEVEQVRRASILALRGMPISDGERQRLADIEKILDRR